MGFDADSGPNLLLDWRPESSGSRRWLRAGIGSVVVHMVLFAIALGIGSLDAPQPPNAVEVITNIQRVTLITPTDLTQKDPNKAKVSKEVNVEDLKPRLASEHRLPPAPAPRVFKPPEPQKAAAPKPGSPEPPKLEAVAQSPNLPPPAAGVPQAKPPEIQPEEKPKLAFETPGQHGTAPTQGLAKVPLPKTTVEDAIHDVARGGHAGNLSVGDIDPVPNLPESQRLPQVPGTPGSSLELLSDPMGVDFKPYLMQILARVRKNWFAVIPESARMGSRGVVLLQFIIDREGQVPKLVIAMPSGTEALDRAAVAAISASVRFPPLPPQFRGKEVRLQFSFKYNVK
jgi:TonB family protein